MAEVILDVAPAVDLGIPVLELAEDLPRTFVEDIDQHVQPPAVGHAHDDLVDSLPRALFDGHVQKGNEDFGPLQRKRLDAGVFLVQELLEDHRLGEPGEDPDLPSGGQLDAVLAPLHAVAKPVADLDVVDVQVLHAHRPAIGPLEVRDEIPQGANRFVALRRGGDRPVEIFLAEPVELRRKFRVRLLRRLKRIESRRQMATLAIGPQQALGAVVKPRDLGVGGTARRQRPTGRIEKTRGMERGTLPRDGRLSVAAGQFVEIPLPLGRDPRCVLKILLEQCF